MGRWSKVAVRAASKKRRGACQLAPCVIRDKECAARERETRRNRVVWHWWRQTTPMRQGRQGRQGDREKRVRALCASAGVGQRTATAVEKEERAMSSYHGNWPPRKEAGKEAGRMRAVAQGNMRGERQSGSEECKVQVTETRRPGMCQRKTDRLNRERQPKRQRWPQRGEAARPVVSTGMQQKRHCHTPGAGPLSNNEKCDPKKTKYNVRLAEAQFLSSLSCYFHSTE